jgi:phospholipid transport system substrate-binding protein
MTHLALATVLFLFAAASPATASEGPVQELKSRVDRAVQVMSDPATKGPAKVTERRAKVRKIADEIFDFSEMSKRSLGVHWQELAPGDRERFVRLFSDLLDRAYFEKIDSYNGEKVTYLAPKVERDQATVPTRVITEKGTEIPVEYRMRQNGGRWQVYDVVIEGVSLVSNYRAQFDRIIRTASVADLLKRMEAQAAGHASPNGQASPGAQTSPAEPKKPRGAGRE